MRRTGFILFAIFIAVFVGNAYNMPQDSLPRVSKKQVKYDTESDVQPVTFDKDKLEDFKNNDQFDYTELKEAGWWTNFKNWVSEMWRKFWNWLLGDNQANSFWAFLIEILPYLIIAGIIAFIIWLFFKLNPGAKILKSKETPEVFFTEEEEIIKTKDIQLLIQKALEQKDYRLAVRYYYLLILKKLREAHLIEYEFDKTNSDYIAEITSEEMNTNFKKVTTLYDYIWYGSFKVTENDYWIAHGTFNHLEHQIPNGND